MCRQPQATGYDNRLGRSLVDHGSHNRGLQEGVFTSGLGNLVRIHSSGTAVMVVNLP